MNLRNDILRFGVFRIQRLLFSNGIIIRIAQSDINPSHWDELEVLDIDNFDVGVSRGLIERALPFSSFEISLPIEEIELGPAIGFHQGVSFDVLASRDLKLNY